MLPLFSWQRAAGAAAAAAFVTPGSTPQRPCWCAPKKRPLPPPRLHTYRGQQTLVQVLQEGGPRGTHCARQLQNVRHPKRLLAMPQMHPLGQVKAGTLLGTSLPIASPTQQITLSLRTTEHRRRQFSCHRPRQRPGHPRGHGPP